MKTRKEQAFDLILKGVAFQFLPATIISRFTTSGNLVIFLLLLVLFLIGYRPFIKGCCLYMESKGYSSKWGWLGVFSVFSLLFFFLITSKKNDVFLQNPPNEILVNEPFDEINIPELWLLWMLAIPMLLWLGLTIFGLLNNLNYTQLISNPNAERLYWLLLRLICNLFFLFILFKKFKKLGVLFNQFIGYKNPLNLKLILLVAVLGFVFRQGIRSLLLYNLSFVYPGYVEEYIKAQSVTNIWIWEVIIWGFSLIILTPLIEGFFLHGIILQKWVLKRGVKAGVLISSLLYSVILDPFDIVNLLLVLFLGILGSILYFKTRNLIAPILFRFFYGTLLVFFTFIDYFSKSTIERSAVISAEKYQASIEPLLGQHLLLVGISVPFLIYFVSKSFPRNDAIIPYYANEAKTPETT